MRVRWLALLLLTILGCGGGGNPDTFITTTTVWLDKFPDIPEGPELHGQPIRVDDDAELIYVEDCATAREATGEGGEYEGYDFTCSR